MDAQEAIAHLADVSPQIEQVAVIDPGGAVAASTFPSEDEAQRFVDGARKLVEAADELRREHGGEQVAQLEAATLAGSVFVVRDGGRMIAATTRPDPTVGLVFYDLKQALRSLVVLSEQPVPERETSGAA